MTRRNSTRAAIRAAAAGAAISMMLALPCAYGNGTGLPLFGISAGAENTGTCGEALTWRLDDEGTLTISGTGAMYDEPETRWKALRNKISHIVVESGATTIGASAFADLLNVESISLPDTLVTIGSGAFNNTGASHGIEYVVIPDSVKSIGTGAFRSGGISRVRLSAGITAIPESAFAYSGLTEVELPDKVTYIGKNAFAYCTALTEADLPEGIVTIAEGAFRACGSLEFISLPSTLETVGERAFSDCDILYGLVLPGNLKTVGKYAFAGCDLLETADIPESVTSFGYGMFAETPELETIYYSGTESEWYSRFEPLGISTEAGVRSHLGIPGNVVIRFSSPQPYVHYNSGLNTNKTAFIPGEEFDLNIYIPASVNKADTIKLAADFDEEAFEVVEWYSNDPSSPHYIRNYIHGGWVNDVNSTSSNLVLTAANTTASIDLSRGILLTAKMRVRNDIDEGDYGIVLREAVICGYNAGGYRYEDFWEPVITSLSLSVSTNPVAGRVSGYGDNEGRVTVTLLNSAGEEIDSMSTADGNYMFSGLTSGSEYTVRASMPHCPSREVKFTAGDEAVLMDIVIRRYGDVNGDTLVDAKDATQILRYDAELSSVIRGSDGICDDYLLTVADIIGSGKPSSKDATQILRYDAGLPSYFDRLI